MNIFTCGGCGKKVKTQRYNAVLCLKCIAGKEKPISSAEIEAAIRNPRYRFEERVQNLIRKGEKKALAEKMIRDVIATKELPNDRPHLHFTSAGEVIFVCADIGFKVDSQDINKVLGTNGEHSPLDSLMDSQIAAIAHSMGLNTTPFVLELVRDPINHLVQMVWYRDLEMRMDYAQLEKNLKISLDRYSKALLEYKAPEPGAERVGRKSPRAPRVSSKSIALSTSYVAVSDAKNKPTIASGRESDLLKAVQTFKGKSFTFAELSVKAKDFLKTKQDWDMICLRFLKELIAHGAVKGVA
jgi:hypothetical protein